MSTEKLHSHNSSVENDAALTQSLIWNKHVHQKAKWLPHYMLEMTKLNRTSLNKYWLFPYELLFPQFHFKLSNPNAVKNTTLPLCINVTHTLMVHSWFSHLPLWLKVQPTPKSQSPKPLNPKPLWTDHVRCLPQMLGQLPWRRAACGLFGTWFNVCLRDHGTRRSLCSLSSKYLPIIYSFSLPGCLLPPSSEDPVVWSSLRLCRSNIHTYTCAHMHVASGPRGLLIFERLFLVRKIIEVESSICPTLLFQLLLFSSRHKDEKKMILFR